MAAPKGNTNAEKWTLEESVKLLELAIEKATETTEYNVHGKKVEGYLCHYIGEAADEAGSNLDQLDYIRDKHNLRSLYNQLKRKCERNCFTDTKKGIIVPSIAIVNLKSNHGWTDRVDNTSKDEKIQTTPVISFFKSDDE